MKAMAIIATIGLMICGAIPAQGQEFRPGLHQHAQGETTGSSRVGGLGFSVQVPADSWPELGRYLTPFVGNFRGGDPPRTGMGPITTGPAQLASVNVLQDTWAGRTIRYTLADGQTMDLLVSQGQRISMSLQSQDFREELGVHQAAEHLAANAVVDGMTLQ